MFVKSEKRAIRISGVRIAVGELVELPDDLLPKLRHLIDSGSVTVHSFDPNSPKAAPRKAASPQKMPDPTPPPKEEKKAPTKRRSRKKSPRKTPESKGE